MSPGNLKGTLITAADGSRIVINETSPVTVLRYGPPNSVELYAVEIVSDGTSAVTFVVPELDNLTLTIGPIIAYSVDRLSKTGKPTDRLVYLNSGPYAGEAYEPGQQPADSRLTSTMSMATMADEPLTIPLVMEHFRISRHDDLMIYVTSEPSYDDEPAEHLRLYAAVGDPNIGGGLAYCSIERVSYHNGKIVIMFWHEHRLRTFDAADTMGWDFLNANNYDITTRETIVTVLRQPGSPARIPKYLCSDGRGLIYLSCGPDRTPESYRIQSGTTGMELTPFTAARLEISTSEIIVRGMYSKGDLILPTLAGSGHDRTGRPRIKSVQAHILNYLWIADYDIRETFEATTVRRLRSL